LCGLDVPEGLSSIRRGGARCGAGNPTDWGAAANRPVVAEPDKTGNSRQCRRSARPKHSFRDKPIIFVYSM